MLIKDQRRILRYYKYDIRLDSNRDLRRCFRHTLNDPMPFKIRKDMKDYKNLPIYNVTSKLVKMFLNHFNAREFLSINRAMKDFAVIQYYFGYILIGAVFNRKELYIKTITFPKKISVNGRKAKRITFKFPRVALKLHSFFCLPQISKIHLASFFHKFRSQLKESGYDLVLIDAPVNSDLDLVLRCTPAFIYWKQVPDRRMFFYLDGKQTSYQKLKNITKQWHYQGFFDKFGARLDYQRESIICNRYITSISNETILPMSIPQKNEMICEPEIINPDTIQPSITEPNKVLTLNTNPQKMKKYGW